MPWSTPTLAEVRRRNRDYIVSRLKLPIIPNSDLRALADANGGLAHLTLQYIDWLAVQLLPDTAETEWLDRHGNIWLSNADGSKGRKAPTSAAGSATMTGVSGTVVPAGTELNKSGANGTSVLYQTTAAITLGDAATPVAVTAIDAGSQTNMTAGDGLALSAAISGVDSQAIVVVMTGGTDEESDDELRARVLLRIQEPPMGGDKIDYEAWALAVPGVTRAWSYPLEMGIGTVTVRFMCDSLRASSAGFPDPTDVDAVQAYLDVKRPVAVKDFFVVAPIPYPIDFTITGLEVDDADTHATIEQAVRKMFYDRMSPGQTVYRSWLDEAISGAVGEDHHELTFTTTIMPSVGHLAVLGTIEYD